MRSGGLIIKIPDTILDLLERRLDSLADLDLELSPRDWAQICAHLLPELYRELPASKRTSQALPGSRSKMMALCRRAQAGQSLFKPGDRTINPQSYRDS